MKLVLGYFSIEDIQFAEEPRLEDGVLFVDEAALSAEVLADERLRAAHFEIARPGESVRIIPVKDVIQPRVKVEGGGEMFPGMASNVDVVGSGTTYVLEGMSVVTVGPIVGFQEGVIDMSGPGEVYSPFSQLNNLVLVVEPAEGVTPQEYEQAVRLAGLKTAMNVAELVRELTPERIENLTSQYCCAESIRIYPVLLMSRCYRARDYCMTLMSTELMPAYSPTLIIRLKPWMGRLCRAIVCLPVTRIPPIITSIIRN